MDARDFYREFVKEMSEERTWRGRTYWELYRGGVAEFTELVNKHVIPGILERAGYRAQNEYYRVDTIGWRSAVPGDTAEASRLGLAPHLWNLLAAVEHENDPADWLDELIKLMHLRCPLKVVVSYSYCDQRDRDMDKLALAAGWMKRTAAWDPDSGEEYLVILGNCMGSGGADYDRFDYRGYLLHGDSFSRI